jgi:lysophospholipase L1-like esterase
MPEPKSNSIRRLFIAPVTALLLLLPVIQVAGAAPDSRPTAIVALGDSYISGEAGRWQGNSLNPLGTRSGTDRAASGGISYDLGRVYGSTFGSSLYGNGCGRSDVAEIVSASVQVDRKVNIACTNARVKNMFRAADGGVGFKGERPQLDQLADIARDSDVKMVVVSVGGNDLGFLGMILACVSSYSLSTRFFPYFCNPGRQRAVNNAMPGAMRGVGRVLDGVRKVMSGAGYDRSDYRLVLQSYPSPIPRGRENRYKETGTSRTLIGGCPMWNLDSNWARDKLVPQISDNLARVARDKGAEFLDLRDAFQGREVCSSATRQASGGNPPSASTSEWIRFLVSGTTQGFVQESFHPNAYGQRALGRCLTLLFDQPGGGSHACANTPGTDHTGMKLTASPR